MTEAQATAPPRIASMDGLRFLMCLGIASLHLTGYFWDGADGVDYPQRFRYFTDVFFVISGFFLARSNLASRLALDDYPRFVLLRWARVYPLYFATLLFYVTIAVAMHLDLVQPENPARYDLSQLWAHVLLMQSWGWHEILIFNYPAWSLSALWVYYLLLPGMLVLARFPRILAALVLVALFASAATGRAVCGLPVTELQTCNLGLVGGISPFLFGVWLATLGQFRLPKTVVYGSLLALVWLLFASPWILEGVPRRFATGAFVFFFLAADYAGLRTPLSAPILGRQGKYAFGLYLVHAIVATVVLRFLGDRIWPGDDLFDVPLAGKVATTLFALALSYAGAVVTYWGLEMPAFRYVRDRSERRRVSA